MIQIKQKDSKWRIKIKEVWEFESRVDFDNILKKLLEQKEKYGNLNNEQGKEKR